MKIDGYGPEDRHYVQKMLLKNTLNGKKALRLGYAFLMVNGAAIMLRQFWFKPQNLDVAAAISTGVSVAAGLTSIGKFVSSMIYTTYARRCRKVLNYFDAIESLNYDSNYDSKLFEKSENEDSNSDELTK